MVRLIRYCGAMGALLIVLLPVGAVAWAVYLSSVTPVDPATGRVHVDIRVMSLISNPVFMLLTMGLPAVLFTLYDWRRRMCLPFRILGIPFDAATGRKILIGLLLGAGLVSLQTIVGLAGGLVYHRAPSGTSAPIAGAIFLFVLVAFQEELIFRGYVLQALRLQYDSRTAIIVSSALFALLHAQYFTSTGDAIFALIALFSFGGIVSVARIVSGSLWTPIAVHFLWNSAAWALGHTATFLELDSPWLRVDYESASRVLVGTAGTGGALDALLPLVILGATWARFRRHPRWAAGPGLDTPSQDPDPDGRKAYASPGSE